MRANDITKLLRAGLLEGVSVLVAGPPGPARERALGATACDACERALGVAVCDTCVELGARVSTCWPTPGRLDVEDAALDAVVAAVVLEARRIDLLVVDGAGLFAHCLALGGDGRAALRACMDATWSATREVVNGAFLSVAGEGVGVQPVAGEIVRQAAGGEERQSVAPRPPGRRIVYLAPAGPNLDAYADAARAGLENLGRTLSIEWARHGITLVTIAPGETTTAGEVASLTAYLASPAGAYFSGCLLDLRGV